jgi:hypothetical protein
VTRVRPSGHGLGHEHAIERVAMRQRQQGALRGMNPPDGKFAEPVPLERASHVPLNIQRPLPLVRRDPFDRMLVAQAVAEDLTLVTADRRLSAYPVGTVF